MTATRSLIPTLDRVLAMNNAFDRMFDGSWREAVSGSRLWAPAMDVVEHAESYLIAVELPGVEPSSVDLSFEQNTLAIRGTKEPTIERGEKEELRVYNAERVSGSFERVVRLPEHVDGDRIAASYDKGVLTISVPKSAAAQPRKIQITGAQNA